MHFIQIFQPILLFLAKLLIPPFNHTYHLQLWAFSGLYSIHLLFSFLSSARQLPSLCFLDSRILLTSFVHCHLISHSLSLWVCTHCPCFTVTLEGLWVMFNQKICVMSSWAPLCLHMLVPLLGLATPFSLALPALLQSYCALESQRTL